jgi:hypothetical protein
MDHYSIVGALILALDLIAIFSLLAGGSSLSHKLLWTLLILLLPLVGMILYFAIGRSPADARV